MKNKTFILCVLALNLLLLEYGAARSEALNIAAFNVEIFGRTKLGRPEVVDVLKQVTERLLLPLPRFSPFQPY